MLQDWNRLSDEQQIALSQQALSRASCSVADQAERLARAIEAGCLADHGGPDALRLLASLVREAGRQDAGGHA